MNQYQVKWKLNKGRSGVVMGVITIVKIRTERSGRERREREEREARESQGKDDGAGVASEDKEGGNVGVQSAVNSGSGSDAPVSTGSTANTEQTEVVKNVE